MQWILLQVKGRACWYALSLADERGPIVHCDAMRTDPSDRLCTGVDSQALRATNPLACWTRTCFLCGVAQLDTATNTIGFRFLFVPWLLLCVAYGCSFAVRFFAYVRSITAAHNLPLLMQRIRRIVESPALGTASREQAFAHSLKMLLPV